MTDDDNLEPDAPPELDVNHASSSMEHLLEHIVLAELVQEAWFGRNQLIDIMHSSVDAFGHDVVLECGPVIRHVQFKARRLDATTTTYNINTRLADRPSGCVVWLGWKRRSGENRVDITYRWFGGKPGDRLPDLGAVIATHTKANAAGVKLARQGIRSIRLSKFDELKDVAELLDRLFGPA